MWTCGFMLSISVALTLASQLYSGNGWVPMTRDVVNNQIKHGLRIPQWTKAVQVPHLVANHKGLVDIKQGSISNHRGLEDIKQGAISNHRGLEDIKQGAISNHRGLEDIKQGAMSNHRGLEDIKQGLVYLYNYQGLPNIKTKQIISGDIDDFNNEKESTLGFDEFNNKTGSQNYSNFLPVLPSNNQEKMDLPVRRSKKLADIDSQVLFNYIMLPKNDKPKNFLKKVNEEELANSTHTYEVAEDTSLEDEKQEESKANENGYEYTRPIKENFTNDLTKYLSKYNINENDNLQNYALSRQPKADNRMFRNHRHKPILNQVPARFNSLNHLPVDPLLAVFLSNYGHYLQGQYGISNNYNNLYGYLASNNIHNNRPFGFYKLFSDTDSSNRWLG